MQKDNQKAFGGAGRLANYNANYHRFKQNSIKGPSGFQANPRQDASMPQDFKSSLVHNDLVPPMPKEKQQNAAAQKGQTTPKQTKKPVGPSGAGAIL